MSETITLDRAGLAVNLESGTSVALRLPFDNDSDDPAAFTGRLSGPGASSARLTEPQVRLGGHGRGAVSVEFAAGEPGRYELGVEVMDIDGYVVEPPGRRAVTLIVTPSSVVLESPAASVAPTPEPVVEEPAPKPKPAPRARKPVETTPPPVEEPAPTPEPVVVAEPVVVVPEPAPAPAVVEVPKPEPPKPEPTKARVVVELPKEEPKPELPKPAPEPTVVTFKREAKPEPVPEPVAVEDPKPKKPEPTKPRVVVEMGETPNPVVERAAATVRRERPYDPKDYGRILRNPKAGEVLELAPGARALVLLDFENRGQDEGTYVLTVKDDLRPTEDFAYARTLLEQVNIRAGGTDELAFEIAVPESAPPQTLRLRITYGRREGGRELEVTRLTLKVSPRIAVRLTSVKPRVVVGPLNRMPELTLNVANEGNVETAYRLTAKTATDVAADALPGEYPDVEGKDSWRYLFDKEAEDLRLDGFVAARLRLLRTGIWWLGWWETQKVKAVAVPVTDPRNAGREGNMVDLTGVRWRLLPAPWYIAVPLLLAFFSVFLGGFGVDNVRVDNAIQSDENLYFVLQPSAPDFKADPAKPALPLTAKISWDALPLSWLKVVSQGSDAKIERTGKKAASVTRPIAGYQQTDQFRVTSMLGLGGATSPKVVYLPMRTTGALTARFEYVGPDSQRHELTMDALGKTVPKMHSWSLVGEHQARKVKGFDLDTVEIALTVAPGDRLYVTPINGADGNEIQVWRLLNPKGYGVGSLKEGDCTAVPPGREGVTWQMLPKAGAGVGTDDLWVLTTDSEARALHLIINRQGGAR